MRYTAAQQKATQGKKEVSSGNFVLVSTLPEKYRTPDIIPPPAIPTQEMEANYTAMYTFICTTIMLHGGKMAEGKLDRYLNRMNASNNTPLGPTNDVLKRMIRDNYILRTKDSGGEEHEYSVGPRGKIEVGEEGAWGLVRAVYGGSVDDLENRLNRSLGISARMAAMERRGKDEEAERANATQGRKKSQRGRRQREASSEEEDSEEEED